MKKYDRPDGSQESSEEGITLRDTLRSIPPPALLSDCSEKTPVLGCPRHAFSELAVEVADMNTHVQARFARFFQMLKSTSHRKLLQKVLLDPKNSQLLLHLVSVEQKAVGVLNYLQNQIQIGERRTGGLETETQEGYIHAVTAISDTIARLREEANDAVHQINDLLRQLPEEGDEIIPAVPSYIQSLSAEPTDRFEALVALDPDRFVDETQTFIREYLDITALASQRLIADSHQGVADFGKQLDGVEAMHIEASSSRKRVAAFLTMFQPMLERYQEMMGLSVDLIARMPGRNLHLLLDQIDPRAMEILRNRFVQTIKELQEGRTQMRGISSQDAIEHLQRMVDKMDVAIRVQGEVAGITKKTTAEGISLRMPPAFKVDEKRS